MIEREAVFTCVLLHLFSFLTVHRTTKWKSLEKLSEELWDFSLIKSIINFLC